VISALNVALQGLAPALLALECALQGLPPARIQPPVEPPVERFIAPASGGARLYALAALQGVLKLRESDDAVVSGATQVVARATDTRSAQASARVTRARRDDEDWLLL
jgi:hypothetical protein